MWSGLDPELRRNLRTIRELVALRGQSPTKEWPLVLVAEVGELLVIREWPGGSMTAYTIPSASIPGKDDGR